MPFKKTKKKWKEKRLFGSSLQIHETVKNKNKRQTKKK